MVPILCCAAWRGRRAVSVRRPQLRPDSNGWRAFPLQPSRPPRSRRRSRRYQESRDWPAPAPPPSKAVPAPSAVGPWSRHRGSILIIAGAPPIVASRRRRADRRCGPDGTTRCYRHATPQRSPMSRPDGQKVVRARAERQGTPRPGGRSRLPRRGRESGRAPRRGEPMRQNRGPRAQNPLHSGQR
jgi:hypothetical protein